MASSENLNSSNGTFQRVPSESTLVTPGDIKSSGKQGWERSQSELNLEKRDFNRVYYKSSSVDYASEGSGAGHVSEHSRVYWDLSKADDDLATRTAGKVKISLQTIHQKEELNTSSTPSLSIQARVFRRMASETSLSPSSIREFDLSLPAPGLNSPPKYEETYVKQTDTPSPTKCIAGFCFGMNENSKPNLTVNLNNAVPILQENIKLFRASSVADQCHALNTALAMIEQAWATPTIGRDLAYGLCDVLRNEGGVDILIQNCLNSNHEVQLGSARVLEQSMTVSNRALVANKGLEVIVQLSKTGRDDLELVKASTGILESLFKHSEATCAKVIKLGGLDSILYSCRNSDKMTLRHCAVALANLAIYGGEENQCEMIHHKTPEWLFPLAFSHDDSIRYYAFLAIATLSANKEIETAVSQSGTLQLVQPFILTHDPADFAHSDKAHIHGQSKEWLRRLVPLLESGRNEAQSLAAFHFAMEAGIKAEQGKREVVRIPT